MLKGWADGPGTNMMFLNIKQLLPWDIALPIRSNFVTNMERRGEKGINGLRVDHRWLPSYLDINSRLPWRVLPMPFLSDVVRLTVGTKINHWNHIRLTRLEAACCSSLRRRRQMGRVLAQDQQLTHPLSFLTNFSVVQQTCILSA